MNDNPTPIPLVDTTPDTKDSPASEPATTTDTLTNVALNESVALSETPSATTSSESPEKQPPVPPLSPPQADTPSPISSPVSPVTLLPDPVSVASDRVFGSGNGDQLRAAAEANGVDFAGYVLSVASHMDMMEAEQQKLVDNFEKSIGPDAWPAIVSALGVAHTTENTRRGLLMLLNSNMLQGQPAQIVSDLFGSFSQVCTSFMQATITRLLGEMLLGFDKATVEKRVVEPFNEIMTSKMAIFNLLTESNNQFTSELMTAMKAKAEAALRVGTPAANEVPVQAPVIH